MFSHQLNFKQTVRLSHFEGGLYALMVATTENFLLYYAIRKNISAFELALLTTVPLLMGALSQIFFPLFVKEKNLDQGIVWTMLLQVVGVFGILYCSFHFQFWPYFLFACLYFMGGNASVPIWLDWSKRLIPKRNYRKYAANRSSYTWSLIVFFYVSLAFLVEKSTWFKLEYIFIIGAVARMISIITQFIINSGSHNLLLRHKHIVETNDRLADDIPFPSYFKWLWFVMIGTALFKLTVQFSGPFFLPYMTNELHLSLTEFVILFSLPQLGRAIFFHHWARMAKSTRSFWGVQLSCFYISIIPLIWIAIQNYSLLCLTEIVAGIFWGGFEMNTTLMVQNFIHRNSRKLLGIHMAMQNILGVAGALIGSYLLNKGLSYFDVFAYSAIARLLVAISMILIMRRHHALRFNLHQLRHYWRGLIN